MSLSSETYKTIFNCNGSTVDFDFDFKVFEETDLEAVLYAIADGTETILTITTHYAVSLLTETGGRVTTVATYSSAYKLIVRRKQPLKQEIDYTQNDVLSTEVLEEQLDKNVMMIQWLYEQIARAILRDASQTTQITIPGAVEGMLLGWASGVLVNKDVALLGALVKASQAEAEAGTENTTYMTPLRTKQTIDANPSAAVTRGTFVNATLSSGYLVITHNKGLSAPYSLPITIVDNSGNVVMPDILGSANSHRVDLTLFGTISGSWGYAYIS